MGEEAASSLRLTSLTSITQGASLYFIGIATERAIGFLTNLVLTRTLGPQQYGFFTYLDTIFALVTVFTLLGSRNALLRYLPEYEDEHRTQHSMMTLAYGTSLVASVVGAAGIYVFAPDIAALTLNDPLFVDVLRVGAIALPFLTLADITYSGFKAIERMEYNVGVSSVVMPLARLVFVGGAAWLGYSVVGSTAGLAIGAGLVFLIGLWVLARRTHLASFSRPTLAQAKEYYRFSVPLTFHHVGSFLYSRIDLLMVGFFLSGASVGIYRITVLVAGLLALPLSGVNQLFPPIASRLYQNGNTEELGEVYTMTTRWIFTLSLLPACIAIAYATEILSVFGDGFAAGSFVLLLFVGGQLVNSLAGPSSYLLMMSGHQYLTTANQVFFGILNVVLNYVLITEFGFIGAAIATAGVLVGINVTRIVEIWYLEGLFPYEISYLKVLVAGTASLAAMRLITIVLDGTTLLVIGGIVGTVVFTIIIWAVVIDSEDERLLREITSG